MPVPNQNIIAGESVVIDSNPQDPSNDAAVPNGNVQWQQDTNSFGTGAPQGNLNVQYKFSAPAGGPLGVTNIKMQGPGGGPTATVSVTVVAGDLDHFSPSFETPTTP